jgi:hypothetical protein
MFAGISSAPFSLQTNCYEGSLVTAGKTFAATGLRQQNFMSDMNNREPQLTIQVPHKLIKSKGPAKFLAGLMLLTVLVTSIHAQANVTLSWNPISNPLVAGFNIYYGGASGVYTNKISVGLVTSVTVSNLVIGTTYYFAATTYSAAGAESALSAAVSYTVPAPAPQVSLQAMPANQFLLTVAGSSGQTYNISASENLTTWTVIGTVTIGSNGLATFTDTNAVNFSRRFYRLN